MAAGGGGVADPFSPAGVPCAFSPQSQAYFALASTDGHLRVWETASNRLHQEYVPSAHLSGTCTCLAWAPARLQAKVKRAGWRGAGGRSASASAFRGLAARDPSSRVALRGPGRGGTERGGGARWAHTVSPVRGLSWGQRERARPDPTGSGPKPSWRAPCGLGPAVAGAAMFAEAPGPPGAASCYQAWLSCLRFSELWLLTEPHLGAVLFFSDPYPAHRPCAGQLEWTSLFPCFRTPPPPPTLGVRLTTCSLPRPGCDYLKVLTFPRLVSIVSHLNFLAFKVLTSARLPLYTSPFPQVWSLH